VRRTAEDQSKQLARQIEQQKAITGESIGAMRLEALSRSTALEAYRQENAALRSQLESETAAARAARAAAAAQEHQKLAAEQKAMVQKETLARKLGVLVAFFDWEPQARAVVHGVRLSDEERTRARAMIVDSNFRVLASSDERGVLTDTFHLNTEGRAIGPAQNPDGSVVGFALTPGYETYAGLGWYGVIVVR
jgi:hypothetical protein